MAKLGRSIKGHAALKRKAKKMGIIISKGKFGRVASFHAPRKKK